MAVRYRFRWTRTFSCAPADPRILEPYAMTDLTLAAQVKVVEMLIDA